MGRFQKFCRDLYYSFVRPHLAALIIICNIIVLSSVSSPGSTTPESATPDCKALFEKEPEEVSKGKVFSKKHSLDNVFQFFKSDERNRIDYLKGRYSGDLVYIIRQTGIKSLLESEVGTSGTDQFLIDFYLELHQQAAAHSSDVRLLSSNFKQHYILSQMPELEFRQKILLPVISRVSANLEKIRPFRFAKLPRYAGEFSLFSWEDWLKTRLLVAHATDLREAAFLISKQSGNIISKEMDFDNWRRSAQERRHFLYSAAQKNGVPWPSFLEKLHTLLGRGLDKREDFLKWLDSVHLGSLAEEAEHFLADLNVGDHFNFNFSQKESLDLEAIRKIKREGFTEIEGLDWMLEKGLAREITRNARFVFVVDVKKLGVRARIIQDQWIARGANSSEIFRLYDAIETGLNAIGERLRGFFTGESSVSSRDLSKIPNANLAAGTNKDNFSPLYVEKSGGDEFIVYFGPLQLSQKREVVRRLSELKKGGVQVFDWELHVSELFEVDTSESQGGRAESTLSLNGSTSLANAVRKAHESLDQSKISTRSVPASPQETKAGR